MCGLGVGGGGEEGARARVSVVPTTQSSNLPQVGPPPPIAMQAEHDGFFRQYNVNTGTASPSQWSSNNMEVLEEVRG